MGKDRYEQQAWNAEHRHTSNRHTPLEELVPGSRNVVALWDFGARLDLLVAIKSRVSIALVDDSSTLWIRGATADGRKRKKNAAWTYKPDFAAISHQSRCAHVQRNVYVADPLTIPHVDVPFSQGSIS